MRLFKVLYLLVFLMVAVACNQGEVSLPEPPLTIMSSRTLDEFEDTGVKMGHTGSTGATKWKDKANSDEYLLKKGEWAEAYLGTVFRFLLGKHAPLVAFVHDTASKDFYAASKIEPSFTDAYEYHTGKSAFKAGSDPADPTWTIVEPGKPLLPPKNGLGAIIVSSMLLGELDLKGLGSTNSNLGVITVNGQPTYFKIDHGQNMFVFGPSASQHDLAQLKDLAAIKNSDYLKDLGFTRPLIAPNKPEAKQSEFLEPMTDADFNEVLKAARDIALVDRTKLEEVLDFCETELKKLPAYPNTKYLKKADNPLLSKDYATFKEAILDRFLQLKTLFP